MPAADLASRWGLHTACGLRLRAKELGAANYLIKELLPARSICLLVGDSGLGKSPLVYQAALCIATGLPFLGFETVKSRVLIADFENGLADMSDLLEQLGRHLGLTELPGDELHLWSLNDCKERYDQFGHTLLDMVVETKPDLVIVDSLSSYRPAAEEKTSFAIEMFKAFRGVARKCGTAALFVHHRRKQPRKADEGAGPLDHAIIRRWFEDSRGSSALVNGSDIRLGVDEPDIRSVGKDEAALVLRGFGRVRGEIGPVYLTRDIDSDGVVLGYRRLTGADLLFNDHQERTLDELPPAFAFKEAKKTYGRADQATTNFLQRCVNLGLLRKVARGRWEKTSIEKAGNGGADGESI